MGMDPARRIVQGADADKDGSVAQAEFIQYAAKLLSDAKLAEWVYFILDANDGGTIVILETLQV